MTRLRSQDLSGSPEEGNWRVLTKDEWTVAYVGTYTYREEAVEMAMQGMMFTVLCF